MASSNLAAKVGTYVVGADLPVQGIMILGNNFDNRNGYERAMKRGTELADPVTNPTWKNLLSLLQQVKISIEECFFTNAFMGITDSKSNLGVHEGHSDPPFCSGCRKIFLHSLELQRPRLLITLGLPALKFVVSLSGEHDAVQWARSWSSIDASPRKEIRIPEYSKPVAIAPLVHPSYRDLNVKRRKCGKFEGEKAERVMLIEAIERTHVPFQPESKQRAQ